MKEDNRITLNICYGCMHYLDEGERICHRCGYDCSVRHNPEDALPEGAVLSGKYLVGRVIGRGGFGVTYLGIDLHLQVLVAIKEYFPAGLSIRSSSGYRVTSLPSDAGGMNFAHGCEAFLKEARMLAKYSSKYVVHVRDYFNEHGTAYIIMDFVDGKTLSEVAMESGGKIAPDIILSLMNPLILQLDKLHGDNMIHRDIKPDNIMLVGNDLEEEKHLVLLDFGAARSFISGNLTQNYSAIVTPGFAPLEQYSQNSRQGPYTDVYALSATIYGLITGTNPPTATERVAENVPLPEFREFGIAVSKNIEDALFHGMELKSTDRTQTMRELYDELNGKPVQGESGESGEQDGGQKDPHRKSILFLIAIVCVALVSVFCFGIKQAGPDALPAFSTTSTGSSTYAGGKNGYYEMGLQAEKAADYDLAASYYQCSSDEGEPEGINKLGECFYYGRGRKKDYQKAFDCFNKAADLGETDALYNLAVCYETGNGVKEKNARMAIAYYQMAADQGNQDAAKKLK